MSLVDLFLKSPPKPVDYMPATRRSRLRFLALVAILAPVYFGGGPAIRWMLDQGEAQADFCDQLLWTRYMVALFAVFMLSVAALLGWQFWRIWVAQQMPLPDAPLLFRTAIVRGWRARAYALPMLVLALAIFGGVVLLASTDVVVTTMSADCVRGDPPSKRPRLRGE